MGRKKEEGTITFVCVLDGLYGNVGVPTLEAECPFYKVHNV
jgi:hypothetical protein